jgi:dipeptidyl aminopeptidase/acylaminoacyl peptidase
MNRAFLAAIVASALPWSAESAEPTPIVLDDFYRLAEVSGPVFSPDGHQIAYSVSTSDKKRDAQFSDIWIVPWKGGAPRQLTTTVDASEWQPGFGGDGKWIAFLSDANEKTAKNAGAATKHQDQDENTQLWRMPAAGGARQRITNLPGGISDYCLSPDGKRVVVVAEVGRTVGNDDDTPPPIETERLYFKEDGRGYIDDRTQQLFVVDIATGKARQITHGARDHWHPRWSPDGRMIAYTGKDIGDSDRTLNHEIYLIDAAGGAPRKISSASGSDDNPDWEAGPSWSADSRELVWLEGGDDKWIYYAQPQLAVADIATGAISHPAKLDRGFYKPRWAPDGTIVALMEDDLNTWLARIDPVTGKIGYLTKGAVFGYDFAVSRGGNITVLNTNNDVPPELYSVEDGRQLTHHNGWLGARALGEVRDVAFKNGDTEIHGFLTLPPDYTPAKRYPLIAVLHGGPVYQHSHEFDLPARLYAAAGYAVLKVNPRGSSGRGFDFSRAIYADWGNVDAKDISAGISHAISAGVADPDRIGVGGWSYGGILTDYMIASDKRIAAAISGAGAANPLALFGVDMYAREYLLELGAPWDNFDVWRKLAYPFLKPQSIKAPTLFECAGADDNVPCAGAQQMYLTLKTLGVPTKMIIYPDENHGLVVPSYLVHRMRSNIAWYDRWLKAPQPVGPNTAHPPPSPRP